MKRVRSRWMVRAAVLALAGLLLVWAAGLGLHLLSARRALLQVEELFSDDLAGLLTSPVRLQDLHAALTDLSVELARVEQWASPVLWLAPRLSWLPGVGPDVAAAPHLLALGQATASGGGEALAGVLPLATQLALGKVEGEGWGAVLATRLAAATSHFQVAETALAQATRVRANLDAGRLSPDLAQLVSRLDRTLPALQSAVQGAQVAPTLLGAETPRTYLLLAQNDHELRATGGFISGVGQVTLYQGRIEDASFVDSYAVDNFAVPHPPPPDALARTMGAQMWLLRDANWSPDFPTSAQVAAEFYEQDQGVAVDGVIAIDLRGLATLLPAIGAIQVPGYAEPVTGSNAEALVMRYWTAPTSLPPGPSPGDWLAHRKDVLADLFGAVVQHVAEGGGIDPVALIAGLRSALTEKHLLLHVDDRPAQSLLRQVNWDGALPSPDDADFLFVVDSNVGFNKVNPNIEQWIDYRADLSEQRPVARLTLTYRHRVAKPAEACVLAPRYGDDYRDLMEQCYWDYLRIYVPAGSELVSATGCDEPIQVWDELGRTVLSCTFVLPVAQARQMVLEYRLPTRVLDEGYRLHLHKQPGTRAVPVRVQVVPPEGVGASTAPHEALALDGTWVWVGNLSRDQNLFPHASGQ
jgi:hypothetical protein